MIDNHFDNFVHGKLNDHEAPVPAGLWDKVADGQFDQFISGKLKGREAPVPADLWGKITDTQFDSFIAGKLADHVAPVPAGLWEKIHPEETDDRKGFAWFRNPAAGMMVAALLLLVATLGGYFYFTSDNAVDNRSDSGSIHKNPAPQPTDGTKVPGIPGNGSAAVTPVTPDGPQATGSAPGITELEKHDAEMAAAGLKKAATPATHAAGRSSVTPPPADQSNSATMNALSGRPGGTPTNSVPADNSVKGFPFYKDPVTGNNGSLKNNGSPATTNNNPLTNGDIPQTNDFAFIEPYHTASFTAVTIPSDANRGNSLLNLSDKQLAAGNHTGQFRNVVICPTDRKGLNTDLHLEVYASPDLAFRSLSNISASQQYLARKDSSSSMQVGYTGGIRLVKPITDNILLKAGVQYTQMNEKFVYRTENEVKTTTVVTVRTIIRAPGDTVLVSDTSIVQQIGFKNNTVKNRYRSFDIPITVGYQFGDDDLKFGINAGVLINISSWYQGVLLDSSLAPVVITKSNDMVYKSNIGLGLYAGVNVVKRLSDDLHLFVEPYFRYNLSNMTTAQSTYNQKFSLGGVSLGLRFNLNRQ